VLAAPCPQTWSRGAAANDKNPPARPGREGLGRSRGGLSTKIHLAADRRCRPVARILSPGQHGDCPQFIPRYIERNTVERCFSKLKQFRAVATRYDKREFMYQGTVDVASIRIWLRDPVP
jgi:hypothetical protein